jgi:hypothetical protein
MRDKTFTDALCVAVNVVDESGKRRIRVIAERLALAAMAGEPWAIEMVADRLDCKVVMAAELSLAYRDPRDLTEEQLAVIACGGMIDNHEPSSRTN